MLELIGVTGPRLAQLRELFEQYGWMIVAVSAISPLPTKATCIAAVVHFAGERVQEWLAKRGVQLASRDSPKAS